MQHVLDTGIFESRSDYEQKKYDRKVFDVVTQTYAEIRSLHPLSAFAYDEYERPHRKLDALGIEYLTDIENATWRGLQKTPALYGEWQRVVEGDETVPAVTLAQLVSKCSPWYQKRGLLPHEYFRRIKQGRKDRRTPAIMNQVAA
jgi:hypothetical protein